MNEDPEIKKTLELVQKLLNKSRGTESEEEAMAFLAGAQRLLAKLNLTMDDLPKGEENPLKEENLFSKNTNAWRNQLFYAVAEMYFCRIYLTHVLDGKILRTIPVFIGKPHNISIAQSMCKYLEKTVLRLAKDFSDERKSRLRFEKGCGMRLAERIRLTTVSLRTEGDGSGLPALYNTELTLVDDYIDNLNLNKTKTKETKWNEDAAAGYRAAEGVHLGGQLGGSSNQHLLG